LAAPALMFIEPESRRRFLFVGDSPSPIEYVGRKRTRLIIRKSASRSEPWDAYRAPPPRQLTRMLTWQVELANGSNWLHGNIQLRIRRRETKAPDGETA